MSKEIIKQSYANNVSREWRRLSKDAYHRLEFETTVHFLNQYLPAGGHILDAGGGPGRYTIHLAKHGYDVTLLDLVPENLEYAKRKIGQERVKSRVREVCEGSIDDLSHFPANSFDAVLCTGGPLSHVLDARDRARAVAELVRVARPGAPIFTSVMSRLSVLVVVLDQDFTEIGMSHFDQMRDSGDYHGEYGFTACHFFLPEELHAAFQRENVTILEMAGLEGISSHHRKVLNRLAKKKPLWDKWLETHYQTCTHPSVVGLSEHMLIVCKKNGTGEVEPIAPAVRLT